MHTYQAQAPLSSFCMTRTTSLAPGLKPAWRDEHVKGQEEGVKDRRHEGNADQTVTDLPSPTRHLTTTTTRSRFRPTQNAGWT